MLCVLAPSDSLLSPKATHDPTWIFFQKSPSTHHGIGRMLWTVSAKRLPWSGRQDLKVKTPERCVDFRNWVDSGVKPWSLQNRVSLWKNWSWPPRQRISKDGKGCSWNRTWTTMHWPRQKIQASTWWMNTSQRLWCWLLPVLALPFVACVMNFFHLCRILLAIEVLHQLGQDNCGRGWGKTFSVSKQQSMLFHGIQCWALNFQRPPAENIPFSSGAVMEISRTGQILTTKAMGSYVLICLESRLWWWLQLMAKAVAGWLSAFLCSGLFPTDGPDCREGWDSWIAREILRYPERFNMI